MRAPAQLLISKLTSLSAFLNNKQCIQHLHKTTTTSQKPEFKQTYKAFHPLGVERKASTFFLSAGTKTFR